MLKKACLFSMFIFVFSFAVSAEEEPTLEQTVKYISNKYDRNFDHKTTTPWCPEKKDARVTVKMLESCQLNITISGKCPAASNSDKEILIEGFLIPLAELDPSKVEVVGDEESSYIKLTTTEDDHPVIIHTLSKSTWKVSSLKLPSIRNYDRTQRLSRAFKHLIRLCGGEEELF
ncbi:MAG: hypothetical protein DRR08_33780 [Candidatus Parabeggiatoa sp. nov. 2]|nr:MAG: hypothetical protein B6247_08820 [Beggiatoa sp. 4572_84]RKZ45879.1 MAG: hypothetical protein DRR08_33780 [Gammaproteobacteria bacterium]